MVEPLAVFKCVGGRAVRVASVPRRVDVVYVRLAGDPINTLVPTAALPRRGETRGILIRDTVYNVTAE